MRRAATSLKGTGAVITPSSQPGRQLFRKPAKPTHVAGLHIAEDRIEVGERRIVLGICPGRQNVGHHDDLEVEHHGITRRSVGAHIGGRAADRWHHIH